LPSIEVYGFEALENVFYIMVLYFEEGKDAFHIDFTNRFSRDICIVADKAQHIASAEFIYGS